MKCGLVLLAAMLTTSTAVFAKADGSWIKKVPQAAHERVNPFAGKADAVSAGRVLYQENCAKCHGENGEGKRSRPPLVSDRIKNATDGDVEWMIQNGEIFKGMPGWAGLPEQKRWQIVAFIRSLNAQAGAKQ